MGVVEMRTIFSTGSVRIYLEESENKISIRKRHYPIYPYGNYYEYVIEVEDNILEFRTVRNNWDGTGSEPHGYVVLSEEEKEEIVKTIKSVRTLEDFDKLIDKFTELKKTREEQINKLWEKLEIELLALISTDEAVRALNLTEEELKEKAREFIEYLVGE